MDPAFAERLLLGSNQLIDFLTGLAHGEVKNASNHMAPFDASRHSGLTIDGAVLW
jgi:hypothetical protein